jgi:3-dehydroquinate dehydratase / shikimate dehydrogenase
MRPFGKDRICGVIAAPTAREMARLLRRALRQTRTVELRLDWMRSDTERAAFWRWLRRQRFRGTLIATCRHRGAGGRLRGGPLDELFFPLAFSGAGCRWVDLSVETADAVAAAGGRVAGRGRMVSWHNFRRTPRQLGPVLRRLERLGWDAVKIAAQSNLIGDSLRLLALARRRKNVVVVPMGEAGLPARMLALRHGSALAYAAIGEKTAPGQLTFDEMKHLYRADRLDRRTRVYGVIGDPIAHSLSPVLHNTGFAARGVNAVYLPFRVRGLRDFLGAIGPLGVRGFSVTLPHKERILRHLDDCDPLAAEIGAVNTVVVRGRGQLYGYNTDYVGVLRALDRRLPLAGSRVLILGAGGVARAVALALARAGAVVAVTARRAGRARRLARAVGGEAIPRAQLRREFFDAIVNATPVGMHPRAGQSPLVPAELNCRVLFDTVYRPQETRLLRLARQRGIETVSGVEMFLAQGIAQWEIWMGERAPERQVRRAVLAALESEARKR